MYIMKDFGRLSNRIKRRIDNTDFCKSYGGSQAMVLNYLSHHEGENVFQKDIEETFDMRASSASELVKKLEANGFAIRKDFADDMRMKRIILTDEGRKAARLHQSELKYIEEDIIKGLTDDEIKTLKHVLEKMISNL